MLKVYVDSGSSIKQEEKEKYNVEIIPLKILLGEKEYLDGVNLDMDYFYNQLIDNNVFPKTSLPTLEKIEKEINDFAQGDNQCIILTISSEISGTYNFIRLTFKDNPNVHVIDSRMAVGGIRLLVDEINRYREEPVDFIIKKVNELIPKVCIAAVPETLDYLVKGGRLSKINGIIGNVLKIKPIIGFKNGRVTTLSKKIGLVNAIKHIADLLKEYKCNKDYDIIASYTYNRENLDKLIESTDQEYHAQMRVVDNLDPAIACHWGPNAFGYIFVADNMA